jgi:hypothetical protein
MMRRRYSELSEKYRRLQGYYNQNKRSFQNLKQEYKEQGRILSITKKINVLLERKIKDFETKENTYMQKIKKLDKMNDMLIDKLYNLQKIVEKKYSDWQIVSDNAWRYSNGKLISYKIPDPYLRGNESNVKFDSDFKMISFLYPDFDGKLIPYRFPLDIYQQLGGNIFCKLSDRYSYYVEPIYEDREQVKRTFIEKRISFKGKYIEELIGFILSKQSSTYSIKEFGDYCGFLNRETRRNYHNKLIKAGMVKKIGNDLFEFIRFLT